jgi:hypothetical protein
MAGDFISESWAISAGISTHTRKYAQHEGVIALAVKAI